MRRILRSTSLAVGALLLALASFIGVREVRSRLSDGGRQGPPCSATSIATTLGEQAESNPGNHGGGSSSRGEVAQNDASGFTPNVTSPIPGLKHAIVAEQIDSWDSLPIGDGRNLGPYMSAFQYLLTRSPAMQGLRDHCVYDGVSRPAGGPPSIFVLNIRTTSAGLTIERATVRDPGALDEYQQRCVAQWMTGVDLEASGVEPGRRYRVTYPIRLGLPAPR